MAGSYYNLAIKQLVLLFAYIYLFLSPVANNESMLSRLTHGGLKIPPLPLRLPQPLFEPNLLRHSKRGRKSLLLLLCAGALSCWVLFHEDLWKSPADKGGFLDIRTACYYRSSQQMPPFFILFMGCLRSAVSGKKHQSKSMVRKANVIPPPDTSAGS